MRLFLSIFLAVVAVALTVFFWRRAKTPSDGLTVAPPSVEADVPSAVAAVPRVLPDPVRPSTDAAPLPERLESESWESGSVAVRTVDDGAVPVPMDERAGEAVEYPEGAMAWNPPPVSSDTLAFVRGAFETWRKSGRDEGATADLRLGLAGRMSREETLAVAATLMKAGTEQDRMDALWMVSNEFGEVPGEEKEIVSTLPDVGEGTDPAGMGLRGGTGMSDASAAGDTAELEREAEETHDVVALVAAGLEDPNADVRQVAYETVASLSQERADALYSQLLCSDSPVSRDLRRQLMEELEGGTDEGSLTLFVQAMQSPDGETAAAAKRNLEAMAGREFESVLDAAEWLESLEADAGDGEDVENEMNDESPTMWDTQKGGENP